MSMDLSTKLSNLQFLVATYKDSLLFLNQPPTALIFSDQPAPTGQTVEDVSEARDMGVVMWREATTLYVSTQRCGVKVVAPEKCERMMSNLSKLVLVDAMMLDMSNTVSTFGMFEYCALLKHINGLSAWDMHNVGSLSWMFEGCRSLENIDELADWDVSQAYSMDGMFCRCRMLENVDALKSWNVNHVFGMRNMFQGCSRLVSVNALEQWDIIRKDADLTGMFHECPHLQVSAKLTEWNTTIADGKLFEDEGALPF